MQKNNKKRDPIHKTQDREKAHKDTNNNVKKEPDNNMTHKRVIKTKKTHKYSFTEGLQSVEDIFKRISTIMINFLIILLVIILVYIFIRELTTEVVLIEPFEVPPELEEQGYNGKVITNKLIDQINMIKTIAETHVHSARTVETHIDKLSPTIMPLWSYKDVEIEVPTAGISLKSVIKYIKRSIFTKPTLITGEIVFLNKKEENKTINKQLYTTIRISGKPVKTIKEDYNDLDNIFYQSAEYICKYTQPYILACYLYKKDKDEECLEIIHHIITNEPADDDSYAYILWGGMLHHKADYNDALNKYQKAIALNPKNSYAYNNCGLVYHHRELFDLAISEYKKSIAINPKNAEAYLNWANALCNKNEYQKAIEKYQKVIELDPCGKLGKVARQKIQLLKKE